jgi:hypothetical protein
MAAGCFSTVILRPVDPRDRHDGMGLARDARRQVRRSPTYDITAVRRAGDRLNYAISSQRKEVKKMKDAKKNVVLRIEELEARIAPAALGVPGTSGSNSSSDRNASTAGGNSQAAGSKH